MEKVLEIIHALAGIALIASLAFMCYELVKLYLPIGMVAASIFVMWLCNAGVQTIKENRR